MSPMPEVRVLYTDGPPRASGDEPVTALLEILEERSAPRQRG